MSQVHTETITFSELVSRLESVTDLRKGLLEERRACAASQPVSLETSLQTDHGEVSALVFILPGLSVPQLFELGTARAQCYNEDSADRRSRASYIAWVAGNVEARVPCWPLRQFPGRVSDAQHVVTFTSGDHAVVATHTLDFDSMDALLADIQCCCAASGPNYRPWRFYSDEEMDLAEGKRDAAQEGVLSPELWVKLN